MQDSCDDILRLAPDCDHTALRFSPAEGFLLSRVDGYTPWRLLREIGGLPAEEVDLCLENWLARGILLAGPSNDRAASRPAQSSGPSPESPSSQRLGSEPPESSPLPPIDESAIDSSLDLDEDVQRGILEFEAGLSRNYFEVLGVPLDADGRAVKKAYFRLCRDFHPDRYFRREIGSYTAILNRIFKRILQAYELLSDDEERAKLALCLAPKAGAVAEESASAGVPGGPLDDSQGEGSQTQPEACSVEPEPDAEQTKATATPRPSALDRLKQRMPFKISAEHQEEGRQKAEDLYKSALDSLRGARYAEAISSIRVALAFDSGNAEYNETLTKIEQAASESRLLDFRNRVDSMDASDRIEGLRECEQALASRPDDPDLNDLVACFCIHTGDFERAQELSSRAIELDPDSGGYHATLGRSFEGMCNWAKAIDELQNALHLDPRDGDSKRRLKALKWRAKTQGK